MKNYDKQFIIAFDPSGNWSEGKGTSGWCVFHAADNKIIKAGEIQAAVHTSCEAYWDKHLQVLTELLDKYGIKKSVIVLEDYLLYGNRATAQTNSRMETPQLLGILKHFCWQLQVPYEMQTAAEVKTRWDNKILLYKKYILRDGKQYRISGRHKVLSRHCLDAIRHAVHYATFKNKEEKK